MSTKLVTFEILTLAGEWKPIFCNSLNSTNKETGCSIIPCTTGKPYQSATPKKCLAYFGNKAGHDRVRIAK